MKFSIDFFELAFLAESCIPPRPIARTMFWHNLSDVYWYDMTDNERSRLFDWIQKCSSFDKDNEDCLEFCNRFNPDNQYTVFTDFKGVESKERAFIHNGKYHVKRNTHIDDQYIKKVEKYESME